ncbi:MAG: hypothetical protein ACUVWP_04140 [bacterium]
MKTIELKYEPYIGDNSFSFLSNFVIMTINDLFPDISIIIPDSIPWQREEKPYEYLRQIARIGDENCGLDIIHYESYEPKYGSLQTYTTTISTYGLPDDTHLDLTVEQTEHKPQFISIRARGLEEVISKIASLFEINFGRIKPKDRGY